ncbi:putative diguanylate cyclase YdaM [bacterium YEK0313]|nr:putative diguanylate cyclase YdaM [bacterium YEK0313]
MSSQQRNIIVKAIDSLQGRTFGNEVRDQGQPDHSLNRKLWIGAGIITICTLILAAVLLARSYDDFTTARFNLHEISDYGDLLEAANRISAERGPTNSVLGEEPAAVSPARQRLARFRAASDEALARLTDHPGPAAPEHVPQAMIELVRRQLLNARAEVDRISRQPLASRDVVDLQRVIEAMFDAVDRLQPAIRWKIARLVARDARLASPVITGQMLGDLREYGGRIASQIMAPIAARRPLALNNLIAYSETRGRLIELWQLVGRQDHTIADDRRLADLWRQTELQFFGDGLAMLEDVVREGRGAGHYTMTPAELTNRFVPTLQPLEDLRRAFLDLTIARVAADRERALHTLGAAIALALAILVILAGLLVSAQRFVFRPLLQARDMVIALADNRRVARPTAGTGSKEMSRLFDAIGSLDGRLRERAVLMEQLKLLADTDALTGLLNRGALERIGETDTPYQGLARDICLILMDVDHFKAINDRHGHLVGDQVLTEVATLVRASLRQGDLVARFGGEEIAILVPEKDINAALALAGRIRQDLAQHVFVLDGGTRLQVTASFGVACGSRGGEHWRSLIEAADAALYQAKSAGRDRVQGALSSLVRPPPPALTHTAREARR